MDFSDAWNALSIGDPISVSNGRPPPSSNVDGLPWKVWRSNNFAGTIVEKVDGQYRSMRIRMVDPAFAPDAEDHAIIWSFTEGSGHTFTT